MGQNATTLNMVAPPHAESIPRVGFPEEISQDELFTSATLQMDARATFTGDLYGPLQLRNLAPKRAKMRSIDRTHHWVDELT